MKAKWLIEDFTQDSWYRDLIKEVKKQGMECVVLDISNHFELKPGLIKDNDCVVFQGSIQLFRKLKKELPAYPLGWMTDENYLCSKYYGYVQQYLFNDKHVFTTLANLKQNKWWFYGIFGKEALIYVRPDNGGKTFTGQLLDLQDFDKFFEDDTRCDCKPTDLIVVSTPKNIRGEWRFVCMSNKEILGSSLYKYNDQRTYVPSAPEKATKLVKEILEIGWYPDPVFTVDVCEDNDGNYWLMEFNSFTSAGTYAVPKGPIVKRVSDLAAALYEGREVIKKATEKAIEEGVKSFDDDISISNR
jgi:hypothetical protein